MLDIIRKNAAALLSLFIFALCSGFFLTLLSLAMHAHNEPPMLIGSMTAIFYVGLVCGSFRIAPFITRVGYIRAFSAFASLLAVMSLLHGMFYNIPLWFILRFITGFGTACLFVVIESWLLSDSNPSFRGRILSLYMITFYASEALGQFLINLGPPDALLLYAAAAIMCSLSVIPLAITHIPMPHVCEPSSMKIRTLYKQATSSLIGAFAAGMVLSASYALFPIVFWTHYHNAYQVSMLMFCLIFGGMILQYPVGKLSDIIDRRLVVIFICGLAIIASILLKYNILSYHASLLLIALLGGLVTTIYPICISYACDTLENKDITSGIQGLLLAYSVGSSVGPFIASMFIHGTHETGLFVYFIVIFCLTAALFAWRKTQKPSSPQEEPFQVMKQTTPVMAKIDPRGE
jgi:MFS family permease